jgi:hypothetical protein
MEEAKTEALKLQNELSRVKLEKLRGDLLEKREVIFLVEHTLVVLRQRILGCPLWFAPSCGNSTTINSTPSGGRSRVSSTTL